MLLEAKVHALELLHMSLILQPVNNPFVAFLPNPFVICNISEISLFFSLSKQYYNLDIYIYIFFERGISILINLFCLSKM